MKIKTVLFSIFIFGAALPFSEASSVSAQFIPPGSYQNTCQNIRNAPLNESQYKRQLIADCRKKNGNYVQSNLAGYFLCDDSKGSIGGISNENGVLTCTLNENMATFQNAKKVIPEALQFMYGNPNRDTVYSAISYLFDAKYDTKYFNGLTKQDVIERYRQMLAAPKLDYEIKPIIQKAIHDVYGRDAYSNDFDKYLPKFAQKDSSYNQIWSLEMMIMNGKDPVLRKLAIGYAFKIAKDRPPTNEERSQWLNRTESYAQMVEIIKKN
jgi:hypothetical protein